MLNAVRDTELPADAPAAVPAVANACRILEALRAPGGDATTLTDLARRLNLPKSTVHNQLATLARFGLVQRDGDSRRFRLGPALMSLGLAAAGQLRSTALLAERLPRIAAEEGVTVGVAQVAEPTEAILVDRAYPGEEVHVGLALGSRYGVFHGAVGKCLLAALEPDGAEALLHDATIPRHTDETIVDPERLLAEVDQIRRRGGATSAGELKENHAVAAGVRRGGGGLEHVLLAIGFPSQMPKARFSEIAGLLVETARQVESATGAA